MLLWNNLLPIMKCGQSEQYNSTHTYIYIYIYIYIYSAVHINTSKTKIYQMSVPCFHLLWQIHWLHEPDQVHQLILCAHVNH